MWLMGLLFILNRSWDVIFTGSLLKKWRDTVAWVLSLNQCSLFQWRLSWWGVMPVFYTSTYLWEKIWNLLELSELLKLKKVRYCFETPLPIKKVAFHPFQVIALMPNSCSTIFFMILDQKTRHYISRHWWGNRKLQLRKSQWQGKLLS